MCGRPRIPSPGELVALEDALAWLGLPSVSSGPGITTGDPVAEITWVVQGYRPGSTVFAVMTSEPGLVAWGTANAEGVAVLQGTPQADSLPAGQRSLRVVGTSVLDGARANANGEVSLGGDISGLIGGFDRDTRISLALLGPNAAGADHVTVRYIDPEADGINTTIWWWLLLLPVLWLVIVWWRRRCGQWTTPTGRVATATTGAVLAAPAVIIGACWLKGRWCQRASQ